MSENELIEAGFQKQECNHFESGNGYDYYYYTKNICDGVFLISSDSDALHNGEWHVISHDIPINIKTKEKLDEFIQLINSIQKNEEED